MKLYRSFIKEGKKLGEWKHFSEKVDHTVTIIVKPNCETLYSSTFIDLNQNSYELFIPYSNEYFSLTILAHNTDVMGYIINNDFKNGNGIKINISSDSSKNSFFKLPKGVYWLIVRFGIEDSENLSLTHELQQQLQLNIID